MEASDITLSGGQEDGSIHWLEAEESVSFTCQVPRIKPEADIVWRINGTEETGTTTDPEDNGDKTYKLTSTMEKTFQCDDYSVTIHCHVLDRNGDEIEDSQKYEIYCKSKWFL